MNIKKHIEHWANLVKMYFNESIDEEELNHIHESEDSYLVIGTFVVEENLISEVEVGKIGKHKIYTVEVRKNEGSHPHFHVFDKDGEHKEHPNDGIHSCVMIRTNKYFKHGPYQDELDRKARKALDKFMRTIRTSDKHSIELGITNYEFTIKGWNDQNHTQGQPNWVNPNTKQPNYRVITD